MISVVSVGRGRKSNQATRRSVADAGDLSHLLVQVRGVDAWWSPHAWDGDRRIASSWSAAAAVVIDVDFYDANDQHAEPPPDAASVPAEVAGRLGATAMHPTPRGARLIFLLAEPTSNHEAWLQGATALCNRLDAEFAGTGYRVDRGASLDLARIFWTPRATVDGKHRNADVHVIGDAVALLDLLPDPRVSAHDDVAQAVTAYRAAHPLDVPRSGGNCPLCGHRDCFGRLPTDSERWFCFSDRHEADSGGVGVRGSRGWHGDVLDLHAQGQGLSRVDLLRQSGMLTDGGHGTASVGSVTAARGAPADSSAPSVGSVSASRGASLKFKPLRPLPAPLLRVPCFDPLLLPAPFRAWVEDIANRIQCPIDFPAVAAMVTYSSLIGRRIGIRPKQRDDWLVVPNLWGGPVGRPGVMKTPGIQEPMSLLRRIEAGAKGDFDRASKEHTARLLVAKARERAVERAIQKAVSDGDDPMQIARDFVQDADIAPVRTRYVTNDVTVEKLGELLSDNPFGVLIFRDELTGLLKTLDKEGHEGSRAFYLEAWNGTGPFTFDRIGRGTVEIPAAICSILGGIQPGPLAGYLKAASRAGAGDDGLIQRFQLLVYPDVGSTWKNVDEWPATEAKQDAWESYAAAAHMDALGRGARCDDDGSIPHLRLAPDGQEAFDAWRGGLEGLVRGGSEHPSIEAHLSKYRSLVPSLALLLHLAEGRLGPVTADAVHRAVAWAKYLEPHARRIYGLSLGSHTECRAIAKHILNRDLEDGFDARRIYRAGWSHLDDVAAVESGIEQLIQFGWLAEETRRTAGRSATVYRINPRIWECPPEGADRTDRSPPAMLVGGSENQERAPGQGDRTDGSPPTTVLVGAGAGGGGS